MRGADLRGADRPTNAAGMDRDAKYLDSRVTVVEICNPYGGGREGGRETVMHVIVSRHPAAVETRRAAGTAMS